MRESGAATSVEVLVTGGENGEKWLNESRGGFEVKVEFESCSCVTSASCG
jgi:hypothetical protein